MGRINPRDRGIHGDTPATSQDQANRSCYIYNFVPGIALFELTDPNIEKLFIGNDVTNQMYLNEQSLNQPSNITNVLTDLPNRLGNFTETNVGTGNTTGLS